VKGDTPERGEAMRSAAKYRDAPLERDREGVKGDTPERGEATRDTKRYCDAIIKKDGVKDDKVKRDKALRRTSTTHKAELREMVQDQSKDVLTTESVKTNKSKIPSVRINKIIDEVDELTREDRNKKKSIGSAYIDIEINEMGIMALLDTGAEISAMTKALFD